MNRFFITTLIAASAVPAFAQNKISAEGITFIENYRLEKNLTLSPNSTAADENPLVEVLAMYAPGYSAADLTAAGYDVVADYGISATVCLPLDEIETFASLDAVGSLTLGGRKNLKMDFARSKSGVDEAQSGISVGGAAHKFSGKGVITGIMDVGLEANHVNFIDETGRSRIERLWVYPTALTSGKKTYEASTVGSFECDTESESHATHVAGIMAGSYKGNGNLAYTTAPDLSGGLIQKKNQPIPYYGVAPDATLALSVGQLYDNNILDGVQNIINYAQSVGQPAVINLSLGVNDGPHDGTDQFTATLNVLGEDAIICVSSGNEGEFNMSVTSDLTDSKKEIKTFLVPATEYNQTTLNGAIDIWADDNRPFSVTMSTYRISDGAESTIVTRSTSGTTTFTAKSGLKTGRGTLTTGVNARNNRYNGRIGLSQAIEMVSSSYLLMIKVSGYAGQKINMYFSGYGHFSSNNIEGFEKGTPDESINSNSIGDNLISVGSYNTRKYFGVLGSNNAYSLAGGTPEAVSEFSSYGTSPDGEILPHILAPGSTIISSFNRYYVTGLYGAMYHETPEYMTGEAANGSETDYWGVMDGTSMAAPCVSGIVALWLEADPTLTVKDIKNIMAETSKTDSWTAARPKTSRYGKIDAAAGLKYILQQNASIGSVSNDADRLMLVEAVAGGYEVTFGNETGFSLSLVDLQGRTVASTVADGATARISTENLQPGIYLM
ncbi:MAG: S8 family serine peptidase, partial [Paramuribaculum sp.]|nr:S8 family serine peptidase [Paramuribaculum sp.]